jgi:prepilin-type N-terminal cleavage/methylation domain-containing protein
MKVMSQIDNAGGSPRIGNFLPDGNAPRRAFTLLELLTVIAIIGVLAGFVVGLAPLAAGRMRESRLRSELASLVMAIENYKAKFGVYPPDNYDAVARTNDTALTPLYYELSGVIVSNLPATKGGEDGGYFVTLDDNQKIDPTWLETVFRREGIVNAVILEQRRKLFRHSFKNSQHAQIYRTSTAAGYKPLEVLAVGFAGDATGRRNDGFAWPLEDPNQPIPTNPGLNPWHYVSSNPTNNPGTFDLWAEVKVRGKTKIFGNWKQ